MSTTAVRSSSSPHVRAPRFTVRFSLGTERGRRFTSFASTATAAYQEVAAYLAVNYPGQDTRIISVSPYKGPNKSLREEGSATP